MPKFIDLGALVDELDSTGQPERVIVNEDRVERNGSIDPESEVLKLDLGCLRAVIDKSSRGASILDFSLNRD